MVRIEALTLHFADLDIQKYFANEAIGLRRDFTFYCCMDFVARLLLIWMIALCSMRHAHGTIVHHRSSVDKNDQMHHYGRELKRAREHVFGGWVSYREAYCRNVSKRWIA